MKVLSHPGHLPVEGSVGPAGLVLVVLKMFLLSSEKLLQLWKGVAESQVLDHQEEWAGLRLMVHF